MSRSAPLKAASAAQWINVCEWVKTLGEALIVIVNYKKQPIYHLPVVQKTPLFQVCLWYPGDASWVFFLTGLHQSPPESQTILKLPVRTDYPLHAREQCTSHSWLYNGYILKREPLSPRHFLFLLEEPAAYTRTPTLFVFGPLHLGWAQVSFNPILLGFLYFQPLSHESQVFCEHHA